MRCSIPILLALSNIVFTNAAPFRIQDGELQRHRRRAVDYPVQSANAPQPARKLRKRDAAPYSVVQVDGDSPTDAAPLATPPTTTVTQPASASTQTVVVTSIIPGPTSDETILITTTQEVTNLKTAVAQTVTEQPAAAVAPTVTSVSVSTFEAQMSVPNPPVANTIHDTVVATVTSNVASSTPTAWYDDGQWHTYYPVKNFVPPPFSTSTSTGDAQATVPTALAAGLGPGLRNATGADTAAAPASSSGWGADWPDRRDAAPLAARADQHVDGPLLEARKAPKDVKVANLIDSSSSD